MKKKIYLFLVPAVVVAALVLWWISGEEAGPDAVQPETSRIYPVSASAEAEVKTVTEWYDAVGTVVPRTQARIEPQVAAQVTDVYVHAGDLVQKGDLLVELEDERLRAKLSQTQQSLQSALSRREQARQAVNSAEAALAQADSSYKRIKNFYAAQAATEQELEQARSHFLQAKAALQRAQDGFSGAAAGIRLAEEMINEAEISMSYTRIEAPGDGVVLKRMVDPGDMAMPGKPVLSLRTAGGLQLEANVRESLINRIQPGDIRQVRLTTLGETVEAVIDEIVPFIDPQTRTFLVKADLPDVEGAYPGMYGKLLIPYREVPIILIPQRAVRQVGQLQLVVVKTADSRQQRHIKTGKIYGEKVEVLSGLSGGEVVLMEEPDIHGQ